ncbi:Carbamoyltransferase HypF [Methanimicrococcus sp. At1]|uniref:Carbamoyltransferase n=1 Tax=Methanimicrococcus hacksteinii TaxID=3028293 RepID=A0ABU3VMQ8_9EURY|nr:carbamoyltransferase HypF [Methanimicrococcus sp. At1]MDV0444682.1 Carbamoyltransferase HypF [Methanimicrococcus sp. At1]
MVSAVYKKILIKGVVQGVGFRPFVYRTAYANHISGSVVNLGNMVQILASGTAENMNSFLSDLTAKNPPLSRIDELDITNENFSGTDFFSDEFLILESAEGESGNSIIPPDTAVCSDCLAEMQTKENRRHLYPFTVCTNCGPRYTTVRRLPYDRKNTVMDTFPLCEDCLAEYTNVNDRRYHAQPTCCPKCGPIHTFEQAVESEIESKTETSSITEADPKNSHIQRNTVVLASGNEALKNAAKAIDDGFIVALKGDGGFHLVCDAHNEEAVRLLRSRLKRPAQPFAVMVRNIAAAEKNAEIRHDEGKECSFLENVRRPILICNKSCSYALAPSTAPKLHNLGIMLPYSAAHFVLFNYLKTDVFVMTSANLPGLPMVIDNDDAFFKLSGVADYFLFHNRTVQNRTDDTVIRFVSGAPVFLRRSRGFVPERICLPFSVSQGIAGVGAEMNNTLSFSKDGNIFLSQYIGNTKHLQTAAYHAEAFETLQKLTGISPEVVVCDMHPDFNTTKFAEDYVAYAAENNAELIRVQHHHAHICSVMADNGLPIDSSVIGIALDGVGYGDDNTVWGGEILKCAYTNYERLSSLAPQPMAGGDLATKYPSRLVFGMLYPYVLDGTLSEDDLLSLNLYFPRGAAEAKIVLSQLKNDFNVAVSSSSGRVLDAAAAMLGLCSERTYDGEPAMVLESAAYYGLRENPDLSYFKLETKGINVVDPNDASVSIRTVLDTSALLFDLYSEIQKENSNLNSNSNASKFSKNELAAMFVHAFAEGIGRLALKHVSETGIHSVCVSGGVANNDYIISVLAETLKANDVDLMTHKNLPPGDGCISHGQVASAAARLLMNKNELRE